MKKLRPRSPEAADLKIGMRIRILRVGQRISQESLAETVGVSFQQIQKYEKGINRVSASRLAALAAALNVDPTEFYPQKQLTDLPSLANLTDKTVIRMLKAFNRIHNRAIRRKMVALVEEIAESRK